MKLSLVAFSFVFSVLAQAADNQAKFSCKILSKDGDKTPIELKFEVLKNGDIKCVKKADVDNCGEWFKYSANNKSRFWLDGLYDGRSGFNAKGDFEVFADSDGCNIGTLVIYKDSGFTKGFITTAYHCSGAGKEKHAGYLLCERK